MASAAAAAVAAATCKRGASNSKSGKLLQDLCKDGDEHVEKDEPHEQNVNHKKQWTGHRIHFFDCKVLKVSEQRPEQRHHCAACSRVLVNVRAERHVERLSRADKHNADSRAVNVGK